MSSFVKRTRLSLLRRESFLWILGMSAFVVCAQFLSMIPTETSMQEVEFARSSLSVQSLIDNPLNAPYKLLAMVATEFSPSVRAVRMVSILYAGLAGLALFYALRHWHTLQTSLLTTGLFLTNAFFLSTSRFGLPLVAHMSFFIFAGLVLWQLHTRSNKAVPILLLASLGVLAYHTGSFWFILILSVVYLNKLRLLFRNVKRQAMIFGVFLGLLALTPLLLAFAREPSLIKEWLLIGSDFTTSSMLSRLVSIPSSFLYQMPLAPELNIARLPVFDLASGILCLVGLNAYRKKLRLDRTKIMIGTALVAVVIGLLGNVIVAVVMLLPFAYSIIAAGIEFLLDEWYSVFPRNPVAKSFGVVLVTIAVLFSAYYQLTRFFVVWPQTPETREVYDQDRILTE